MRLLFAAVFVLGCGDDPIVPPADPVFDYPLDDALQLHHLQAKSTHNSYHVETEGNMIPEWHYTHVPLDRQLGEQGVRHFELDLSFDYDAGVFQVFHVPELRCHAAGLAGALVGPRSQKEGRSSGE